MDRALRRLVASVRPFLQGAVVLVGLVAVLDCSGRSTRDGAGDDTGGSARGGSVGTGGSAAGSSGEGGIAVVGEGGQSMGGLGGRGGDGAAHAAGTGAMQSGGGGATASGGTGASSAAGSGMAGSGTAGSGTAGRATGDAGGTSAPPAPSTWTCTPQAWNDGRCHCGCGAIDWDCHEWTLEECEVCDDPMSCSGAACPGTIYPELVVRCDTHGWLCASRTYRDGICDCGCGVLDPDCADESVDSCERCNGGCSGIACPGPITTDDNTSCSVPQGWTCPIDLYGNGTCECGCGVIDIDCASPAVSACDHCDFGCAEEDCPATIAPEDNATCSGPPPSWTCSPAAYDDGLCHCGCGAADLDCDEDVVETCDVCDAPGSCSSEPCPGAIQASHTRACVLPPLPPEWTCSHWAWADNARCDCGCGAVDPDCVRGVDICHCGEGSCSAPDCLDLAPDDSSRCVQPR